MQMLLKQKSDHLGFDKGPKGYVCERDHYFWFLLPDLGDSAVSFFLSQISLFQMISDLTYLSSSLVVVQVHQADRVLRSLSAFPPVLSVNKSSGEGDTKVNVVGAARPLWIKDDERGYVEA